MVGKRVMENRVSTVYLEKKAEYAKEFKYVIVIYFIGQCNTESDWKCMSMSE